MTFPFPGAILALGGSLRKEPMESICIFENDTFEFFPIGGYFPVDCACCRTKSVVPYDLRRAEIAWICDNGNGSPACTSCICAVRESILRKLEHIT